MKNFLVIYHAPASVMQKMATATPEENAKGLEAWMTWKNKHDAHVVNFGAPVMGGQTLADGGNWNGSQKDVSGFSILQGENIDEIKGILADHPHVNWAPGCTLEVHESVAM